MAIGFVALAVVPTTAMAATQHEDPPAAGPAVPTLAWGSCDGDFQCATASVPLDYRQPRGATITIATIRHLVTTAAPGRDAVLQLRRTFGADRAVRRDFLSIPAPIRERFDIVSFDPRGFGSVPRYAASRRRRRKHVPAGQPRFPSARAGRGWERSYARFDARAVSRTVPCWTMSPRPTRPVTWTFCAGPVAPPL